MANLLSGRQWGLLDLPGEVSFIPQSQFQSSQSSPIRMNDIAAEFSELKVQSSYLQMDDTVNAWRDEPAAAFKRHSDYLRTDAADKEWRTKLAEDAKQYNAQVAQDWADNGPCRRMMKQLMVMKFDADFRTVCPRFWKVQRHRASSGHNHWVYMHAVSGFTDRVEDAYCSRLMIIFQLNAFDWQLASVDDFIYQYERKRRGVLKKFENEKPAYQQYLVEYNT